VACQPPRGATGPAEATTSQSGLQHQGDGQWHYNWTTSKSWAGTCRVFTLTLADGSQHHAHFRFR
jgi:hypothetical protein